MKLREHKNKAAKTDKRFKHVMAITLDPRTNYREGVIRCITSRTGPQGYGGQIDRSVLHKIVGKNLNHFEIQEEIAIKNQDKFIKQISTKGLDFLGLEDPDIWIDDKKDLMHLYFTLPLIGDKKISSKTHLGHAQGKSLTTLTMTDPVLLGQTKGAKEVCIAPLNNQGFRYNLVESSDKINNTQYSVVRVAIAKDMGKGWKFGKIAFHPAKHNLTWIAGHASPGPLFPKTFIDIGEGKRVGLMNGCEANKKVKGKVKYGTFSVGLFIYDYEKGKIDWVSPKPFIQDSAAGRGKSKRKITFASQFVETTSGKGIVYAHVDDSFVRTYDVDAESIKKLLPK